MTLIICRGDEPAVTRSLVNGKKGITIFVDENGSIDDHISFSSPDDAMKWLKSAVHQLESGNLPRQEDWEEEVFDRSEE
ncbi:hypothetical protein [Actinomadura rubrisoli]|uniref:Uncharacterized protein n=1 Tax=Actinomadura rubrisoli TaxID=2530368 RepID=A0A4R5CIM1_9ACTN|nr:hypothetical protein [Actinomadura rubrisoli]TDD97184.1 hypothetical protein E1298_01745 [Actinomadura rubrisoli]